MSRQFTKVTPAVWRSKRFKDIGIEAQLLYLYFLTSEHQNSAGCYYLPSGYACVDLGWTFEQYEALANTLVQVGLIVLDWETDELFITRWFTHNPAMNSKHALGIDSLIQKIESQRVREWAECEFNEREKERIPDETQRRKAEMERMAANLGGR